VQNSGGRLVWVRPTMHYRKTCNLKSFHSAITTHSYRISPANNLKSRKIENTICESLSDVCLRSFTT